MRTLSLRFPIRLLLVALALGIIFDLLFYAKLLGVSVPIFTSLIIAALYTVARWEKQAFKPHTFWLVVGITFFAVMVFIRANLFLTVVNVFVVLLLLALLSFDFLRPKLVDLQLHSYPFVVLAVLGNSLLKAAETLHLAFTRDVKPMNKKRRKLILPIVRGLLLAAPILLIFGALLASADLVFANQLEQIFNLNVFSGLEQGLQRGFIILTIAYVICGALAYALSQAKPLNTSKDTHHLDVDDAYQKEFAENIQKSSESFAFKLGFIESGTVLALVNILFFSFILIQLAYLFGGDTVIQSSDFTYAEYARRGFFELIFVTMLSLMLMLVLKNITKRESPQQEAIFKILVSIIVTFVGIMLVSAYKRLGLYELTYGLTELRLYSHSFTVWLGAVFVWFTWTLWITHSNAKRFAFGFFIACLSYLVSLNLLNPDVFIIQRNIQHERQVDTYYFTKLSDDAIPALVQYSDQQLSLALETHLKEHYLELERDRNSQTWPSFHLSRWRAHQTLKTHFYNVSSR